VEKPSRVLFFRAEARRGFSISRFALAAQKNTAGSRFQEPAVVLTLRRDGIAPDVSQRSS